MVITSDRTSAPPAPDPERPPPFSVATTTLSGAPCVCARGELDVATVSVLAEPLEQLIRESAGVLVVDLCDVSFLDSTGISVLVRARALLGRGDRELLLVCPPGPLRRVLELTGVADLFAIAGSREDAAASLLPRSA
jgi:anti-sigma B factor antagonist